MGDDMRDADPKPDHNGSNRIQRNTNSDLPAKADTPRERDRAVAFSTKLPLQVQRELKVRCAEQGIRIQDAVLEAVKIWMA